MITSLRTFFFGLTTRPNAFVTQQLKRIAPSAKITQVDGSILVSKENNEAIQKLMDTDIFATKRQWWVPSRILPIVASVYCVNPLGGFIHSASVSTCNWSRQQIDAGHFHYIKYGTKLDHIKPTLVWSDVGDSWRVTPQGTAGVDPETYLKWASHFLLNNNPPKETNDRLRGALWMAFPLTVASALAGILLTARFIAKDKEAFDKGMEAQLNEVLYDFHVDGDYSDMNVYYHGPWAFDYDTGFMEE